jgi:hypothetical protein
MHVKLKPLSDGKFVLHGCDPQECGGSGIWFLNNLAPHMGDNGLKPFSVGKFMVHRCEIFMCKFLIYIYLFKKMVPHVLGNGYQGLR